MAVPPSASPPERYLSAIEHTVEPVAVCERADPADYPPDPSASALGTVPLASRGSAA